MRNGVLVVLVFLSLTVIAYNYQFFNIPTYMFLNAYNLAQKGATEFRITLPSKGIPHEYRNVTYDDGFRVWVLDYVIACDTIRTGMVIKEYDTPYDWLKNAVESPKGYDMTIDYYNETYFLQVRYETSFYRTDLEYTILWTINIVTAIAWLLFIIDLVLIWKKKRLPSEKRGVKNNEKNCNITIDDSDTDDGVHII